MDEVTDKTHGDMKTDLYDPTEFIKTLKDSNRLKKVYSEWLGKLFESKLWDGNKVLMQKGRKIPWKKAEEAFAFMEDTFNSPGLYIFGIKEKILYLGMTNGKLRKRLRSRYFGAKNKESKNKKYSQFQIAADFENDLREKGWEGLSKDYIEWYKKNYNSTVRLEHAEKLAKCGISGIWFAVLSFKKKKDHVYIGELEKSLIKIANEWNREKSYPELLNAKHKS